MRQRIGPVPGMTVARVYDEQSRDAAEKLSAAYGGRPKVCSSLEEASDDVDLVYVADCNYEGKDHLRFAEPGLKKGVPHFIDKPFAYTLADAREIIRLAERHRTAVMCASLLRYSPYLERFRVQFADIAPVGCVLVPGLTSSLAVVFHALSSTQNLMGVGCEWVESMGAELFDVVRLHYPGPEGGIEVVIFSANGGRIQEPPASRYHHCANRITAYGAGGVIHSPKVDDYRFADGGLRIVRMAREMALTKRPPIDYGETLELMKIIEAARLAQKLGRRVTLQEVR